MLPDYVVESALGGTLFAAGLMAAFLIVAAVVQLVFVAMIKHRRRISPESLDVDLLQTDKGPVVLFVIILGLFFALMTLTQITHPSFEVIHGRDAWSKNAWMIVVIIEFSYLGSHLLQTMMTWYLHNVAVQTATDLDDKLIPPLRRVAPLIVSITATSRAGSFIVGSELIKRIHKRFKEEGIEINYPVTKFIFAQSNGTAHQDILEQVMIGNQEANQGRQTG
mgnify:CR=1 FL=1